METKQNTGAIFKNDKKTNEKQPDYKGKVNVNGKDLEIALWVKTSAKGTNYFSCSFSEPYVSEQPKQIYSQPKDDLPF